jgi:hypothetical protein
LERFLKRCPFDTSVIEALGDDLRLILCGLLAECSSLVFPKEVWVVRPWEPLPSHASVIEEACCLLGRDVLKIELGCSERPDPITTTPGERPEGTPTCDTSTSAAGKGTSGKCWII